MRFGLAALCAALLALVPTNGPAGVDPAPGELPAAVEQAWRTGEISADEALVCGFRYVLAPETLPQELRTADPAPLKCASPLVQDYLERGDELAATLKAEIGGFLLSREMQASITSPQGLFRLAYDVSGEDAVPLEDGEPANGVPDYVERAAVDLETAWRRLVVEDGFTAPRFAGEAYPVSFRNMNAYGYTVVTDPSARATRIVLHCDYEGFPANDDPAGDRRGTAKISAAHELKHASQYAASRWSEGGWIEADAVWAEERVFDEVNDYYAFLSGPSPVCRPEVPLDDGGGASYEDAVFAIWLEQEAGLSVLRDFWNRRSGAQTEAVTATWRAVLTAAGLDPGAAWARFTAWNYATDTRAAAGTGYQEAERYPRGPALPCTFDEEIAWTGEIEHLAARFFRMDGPRSAVVDGPAAQLEIALTGGVDPEALTLGVHVRLRDGSAWIETATGAGGAGPVHLVTAPWAEIESIGLAVGNAAPAGDAQRAALYLSLVDPSRRPPLAVAEPGVSMVLASSAAAERVLELFHTGTGGEALRLDLRAVPAGSGTDASWLSCDPPTAKIPPGGALEITLRFAAGGMPVGVHRADLLVRAAGYADPFVVPVCLGVEADRSGTAVPEPMFFNSPNPFNPVTRIRFETPTSGLVVIDVLDLRGQVVRRLLAASLPGGSHEVEWDGRNDQGAELAAGLYLARLRAGGRSFAHKMILAK